MKKKYLLLALAATIPLAYLLVKKDAPSTGPEKEKAGIYGRIFLPDIHDQGAGGARQTKEGPDFGAPVMEEPPFLSREDTLFEGAPDFSSLERNSASCLVQGPVGQGTRRFVAAGALSRMTADGAVTGYVARFVENPASRSPLVLVISLPPDAKKERYREGADNFAFLALAKKGDSAFRTAPGLPFSLVIHDWPGPGGAARGVFSGTLRDAGTGESITVREGRFVIDIR